MKAKISINKSTSKKGLKEYYFKEASSRPQKAVSIMQDVYSYIVENRNGKEMSSPIKNGSLDHNGAGEHITINVKPKIKEEAIQWAKEKKSSLAKISVFILEKGIELKIIEKIYKD